MEVAAVQHRHEGAGSIQPRKERLLPGDRSLRIDDPGTRRQRHKDEAHSNRRTRHVTGAAWTCSNGSCAPWVQVPPWPGELAAEGSWRGWWRKRSQTSPAAAEARRSPTNTEEENEAVEEPHELIIIWILHHKPGVAVNILMSLWARKYTWSH